MNDAITKAVCGLGLLLAATVGMDGAAQEGEWPVYGADKAGTKYSALNQIERDNFADLEVVWRWKSVDGLLSKTTADGGEWWSSRDEIVKRLEGEKPNLYRTQNSPNYSKLQATPLMVGGVLYLNTHCHKASQSMREPVKRCGFSTRRATKKVPPP